MPSYKTHSIHGEVVFPYIDSKVKINKESLKSFCIGPDAMSIVDYKTFDYQHAHKTKEFFITLLNKIKQKKLQDNSEVMAFLYGQLDHFVLDIIMHPLIYYMTEDMEVTHKFPPHTLVEFEIDNYVINKCNKNQKLYYREPFIKNRELKAMINELYKEVYDVKYQSVKYNIGMPITMLFDTVARHNLIGITPLIISLANTGDFRYKKGWERVIPYLNNNNDIWFNPETGEQYNYSFDNLWDKSIEVSLQTIKDVNDYIYLDKPLTNSFITNDLSYNTGLPCEKGQSFQYIKKYQK